ncbi:BICD family-like cargo adapter 1 isoform X1 [Prionailurus viverrinus]|uniref:BICD family-like cargo adapter 1 isoform X1 n=1 Tax=Lynx canadensis TaxID=61383 RepID=UPI0011B0ED30|nr:BICD family-like cargo adapter 1 isoform X1 [Lynx canadensis]XP_043413682.1 BICD family-like cargo adapter 1 isoform X2 [Prionailurus bengalensis]XP_046943938.1 BICD family-like cargo adapter 1 isoform X1 [Lynx rufus]XP_047683635.1 BICD family-like cargo adapter 1 isoform X1 [Prionailurus viverrinus]
MSAFCLGLAGRASAPAEPDSACCMELPAAAADAVGSPAAAALISFSGGSGELELALEEELALLAAGERPSDPGEHSQAEAGPPAEGSGLQPPPAQDPELLSVIRQKEKDLVLAARLGKALLERNQDMSRQYEQMHKELTDKLEHLEQEKHELRRRFENREGEWEGRVSELESDVKQLQDELERQQVHLREADREKTRAVQELSEQNQRLLDQLSRASEVERQLSMQVHALREDFREKNSSTNQHIIRLESLQAEIKMLSDRKRELEHRLSATLEENDLLQGTVEELQDRVLILERQGHDKDLQLHQSQLELQEVRLSYRQLQVKVEELTEERSLQSSAATSTSLLSEIEQSMEAEELEQEREQLRLQLWEAYCQVRYLCSHLRGNDSADSAVSTDSSMDESSETSSAKDVPAGSLRTALSELKRLIQSIVDGMEPTSSRRIDDDSLEEQIRQTSEDSRALRELMEGERGKLRQSLEELQQLHSQVTLLSVEMTALKEERDRLRVTSEDKEPKEQLQKAIRDRDEAIAKKNAVELELAKCKMDMMSLNSQLLDAIQQKLNLSQQLEAWQDDMHRVIDRQLMDTRLKERSRPAAALSGARGAGRGDEPSTTEGKRLFSFFRKT